MPFNNIRCRTGEHMVRSKATSPHVFTVMEVDVEGVEKVRRAHKERFKAEAGISLTYCRLSPGRWSSPSRSSRT